MSARRWGIVLDDGSLRSGWLNSLLLYWDGIHRVVSDAHDSTADPPHIQELAERKLLVDVPAAKFRAEAARHFMSQATQLGTSRLAVLRNVAEGLPLGGHERLAARSRAETLLTVGSTPPVIEVDASLRRLLAQAGLGTTLGESFLLHPSAERLMTRSLLHVAAEDALAAPIAARNEEAVVDAFLGSAAPEPVEQSGLLHMVVNWPHPASLENLDPAKLVAMRLRWRKHQDRFREAFETLGVELSNIDDPAELRRSIEFHRVAIDNTLDTLKAELAQSDNDAVWELGALVPLPAAVINALQYLPALGGGTLAFTILAVLFGMRRVWTKRKVEQEKSFGGTPWSYLLLAEQAVPLAARWSSLHEAPPLSRDRASPVPLLASSASDSVAREPTVVPEAAEEDDDFPSTDADHALLRYGLQLRLLRDYLRAGEWSKARELVDQCIGEEGWVLGHFPDLFHAGKAVRALIELCEPLGEVGTEIVTAGIGEARLRDDLRSSLSAAYVRLGVPSPFAIDPGSIAEQPGVATDVASLAGRVALRSGARPKSKTKAKAPATGKSKSRPRARANKKPKSKARPKPAAKRKAKRKAKPTPAAKRKPNPKAKPRAASKRNPKGEGGQKTGPKPSKTATKPRAKPKPRRAD